ncbi:MAG: hypothetical protein GY772_01890, partial [bacterium]|nr:hypothetical protein [bacterium]
MFDPEMADVRALEEDPRLARRLVRDIITQFECIDSSVNSGKALDHGKSNVLFACKMGRHRGAAALACYIAWNCPGARPGVIKDFICIRRPQAQFLDGPFFMGKGAKRVQRPGLGPFVEMVVETFRAV